MELIVGILVLAGAFIYNNQVEIDHRVIALENKEIQIEVDKIISDDAKKNTIKKIESKK